MQTQVRFPECAKVACFVMGALVFLLSLTPSSFAMGDNPTQVDRAERRLNIIFIMSDDHTTQAIGAYGSRLASLNPSPRIDELAKEGTIFDNVFVTNSICAPSRATILTGQYSQANGVLDLGGRLPASRQYLAQLMSQAGYYTSIIGKWHLKDEPAAFDYYKVLPGQGAYFNPDFRVRGDQPWPKNTVAYRGHSTDIITDQALSWLQAQEKN